MSPFCPQCVCLNAPPAELAAYHQSPLDGLKIARSPFPSPSKSPTRGWSPAEPNTVLDPCRVRLLNRYQVLLPGLNRTRSALPSPSKSDGRGISFIPPNWFNTMPPVRLLRYHH